MSPLTRNIAYNLIGQVLLLATSLAAVKVVYRELGSESVGIIFAAATLAAVLSATLDLGFSATMVRQVSAHVADERSYVTRLVQTASLVYWLVYLALVALTFFAAPYVAGEWLQLRSLDIGTATEAFRVLGISALLVLPRSLYASTLRGLQRMEFNNIIDVAVNVFQQVGMLALADIGADIVDITYWSAACIALGMVAYLIVTARFVGWDALIPKLGRDVIRRNVQFSSNMALISLIAPIHAQADRIFISKLLPFESFGIYALTSRIVGSGTLPSVAVAQAALPMFSSLARGPRGPLLVQYRRLHDLLCLGMAPVFAGIAYTVVPLLGFVLDSEEAQRLFVPAVILCVGFYMNATVQIPYVFSLAVDRPQITARLNVLALFTVLPLTGLLVLWFGLTGAALSWIVYYLWTYGYWVRRVCRECLRIEPREWYGHLLRIGALIAATYGLGLLLAFEIFDGSVGALAAGYVLASAFFFWGAARAIRPELRDAWRAIGTLGARLRRWLA